MLCNDRNKSLFFYLQVTDFSYLTHFRDLYHAHGLITTSLGLNIPVDGRHFFEGTMRVRCVASLSPSLWQNGRESIVHRRPSLMDSREAMLLGNVLWKFISALQLNPSIHPFLFTVYSGGDALRNPIAIILIAISIIIVLIT